MNATQIHHVAYYRVSTDRQGASGLGLEAQQSAVERQMNVASLLAEFKEIESGKNHTNRPQLTAAVKLCQKQKATLIIAKLDRRARDVHFISGRMKTGVDFVAVDMPHANKLDRATGAEIDEELGWGPPPLMTGSYIDPSQTEPGIQRQQADPDKSRRSSCRNTLKRENFSI